MSDLYVIEIVVKIFNYLSIDNICFRILSEKVRDVYAIVYKIMSNVKLFSHSYLL